MLIYKFFDIILKNKNKINLRIETTKYQRKKLNKDFIINGE